MVLALLGGLILNLMPCVLPVLAVKALGFASHANEGRGMGRHGAAYTLGVLASFAIVGAVLLAVRGAGAVAGWGFQLQEPVFVLLMAWLMVLIGLNFAGLFEIGGRLVGIGSGLAGRSGLSGSFFTGVLAVIVATPCTAPFMGAAVGFGLSQPAAVAMAVMLALGLGLALPFLLLSLAPGLLRLVPKPGPWMVRFKQLLAFPMFATAAWLVWVLSLQAGDAALLARAGRRDPARLRGLALAGQRRRRPLLAADRPQPRRDSGHCRLCHGSVRRQRRTGLRRKPANPPKQQAAGSFGSRSAKRR